MDRVTVIGFYSFAHAREKMIPRLERAVASLQEELFDTEINLIDFVCDNNEEQIDFAKKKLEDTISSSSSIILVFSGWAQSVPIIRIIEKYLHLPIIIWSLSGYYGQSGMIAPAAAAGASLLRNTLNIYGCNYFIVYDNLKEEIGTKKVVFYLKIAASSRRLQDYRAAAIGYACSNLYPFMYDGSLIKKYTGIHVDNLELMLLERLAEKSDKKDIEKHIEAFAKKVKTEKQISEEEIYNFSKYTVALKKLIKDGNYRAVTIKCGSGPGDFLNFTPCMLLSWIADSVEAICECDVYNLILQIILKEITGLKTTFLEIFEFYSDSVLMASCGFAPFSLCSEPYRACGHDWGGTGGIMNISSLKTGRLSLLSLSVKEGIMNIDLFKGVSKQPEKFQEEGWQNEKGPFIPSLEVNLKCGNDVFKRNISGPHYIAVSEDVAEEMDVYCRIRNIVLNKYS